MESIGADESQWPQAARDALSRQAKKLDAMHDVMSRLQSELDNEQHNLAVQHAVKQTLQVTDTPQLASGQVYCFGLQTSVTSVQRMAQRSILGIPIWNTRFPPTVSLLTSELDLSAEHTSAAVQVLLINLRMCT